MKPSERIAKLVVEHAVAGSRMEFREAQQTQTHDFDLFLPDGRVAALEVTAAVDAEHLGAEASILDERKGGPFVARVRSKNDWYVNPVTGANINRVRQLIDEYLADVEAEGITQFFSEVDAPSSRAVGRIWSDLGIEAGSVLQWKPSGRIGIGLPAGGGWITPQHVQDAVRIEAFKIDNRSKLARAETPDRHFFVYIDASHALAWMAMQDLRTGPLPHLPPEITHVWVCARYGHTLAALSGSVSGGSWHRLSPLSVEPG